MSGLEALETEAIVEEVPSASTEQDEEDAGEREASSPWAPIRLPPHATVLEEAQALQRRFELLLQRKPMVLDLGQGSGVQPIRPLASVSACGRNFFYEVGGSAARSAGSA